MMMIHYTKILFSLLLVISETRAFLAGRTSVSARVNLVFDENNSLLFRKRTEWMYAEPSVTALSASSTDEDEDYSIDASNAPFGLAWVALLAFTVFIAPGELQSDFDNNLIQAIISNPVNPDINELYFFVFNLFAVIPTALASVALPQASKQGPPVAPFLIGASALGYFVFGPYMVLRGKQKEETSLSELGWVTANILENKIFSAGSLCLAFFFASQVPWGDFSSLADGYSELAHQSKFVAVSSVDLLMLSAVTAALIPQDYRLRDPENADKANLIAASTMLLPVFGSAIYCVLRPSLPEE